MKKQSQRDMARFKAFQKKQGRKPPEEVAPATFDNPNHAEPRGTTHWFVATLLIIGITGISFLAGAEQFRQHESCLVENTYGICRVGSHNRALPLLGWNECEQMLEPVQEECGVSGIGNGLDDDCDGTIDEVCEACMPGSKRSCIRPDIAAYTTGVQGCELKGSYKIVDGTFSWVPDSLYEWGPCEFRTVPIMTAIYGIDDLGVSEE